MGLYSLGFGLAASALGSVFPEFPTACDQYRPNGLTAPISQATQLGVIAALFDTRPDFKFKAPSLYAKAEWYGLFDFSLTNPGDYLVSDNGTWFVGSVEDIHPPLCIKCNRTLTLKRDGSDTQVGAGPYGGRTEATDTILASGWPASVLLGTKGEANPVSGRLPADTRTGWWKILLPPSLTGITLGMGDIAEDDLGRRYVFSACELSALGWNCTAMQAQT